MEQKWGQAAQTSGSSGCSPQTQTPVRSRTPQPWQQHSQHPGTLFSICPRRYFRWDIAQYKHSVL